MAKQAKKPADEVPEKEATGEAPQRTAAADIPLVALVLTAVATFGVGLALGSMCGDYHGRSAGEDLVRNEAIAAGAGRFYERCGMCWWAWHRPRDGYWIETLVDANDRHEVPVVRPAFEMAHPGRGGPYQPLLGVWANGQGPAIGEKGRVTVAGRCVGYVRRNADGTWTADSLRPYVLGMATTAMRKYVPGMATTATLARELDAAWWLARRWEFGENVPPAPPPGSEPCPAPPPGSEPRPSPRPAPPPQPCIEPAALNGQRDA